jgi:hypothetical protein
MSMGVEQVTTAVGFYECIIEIHWHGSFTEGEDDVSMIFT